MDSRSSIELIGVVQGVGFRPHAHALATAMGLSGFVRNEGARVRVEVEGPPQVVDAFTRRLVEAAPPLARVESVRTAPLEPRGSSGFEIHASVAAAGEAFVAADAAPCADCLAEMRDPASRRYRYPFSCCSHCGPRLTVVERLPYDRANTTLAAFPMCGDCRAEYENPADRRFHAEPIACPACGPRLEVSVERAAEVLRAGGVVAVKGAGGYHLACDARDALAVRRLRERKHRDEKPFAVMVDSLEAARALCELSDDDARTLASPERPIVLMPSRGAVAPGVAPGLRELGVMLPSTLLHALLFDALGGGALVMTSGNRSDEPMAFRDDDARARLASVADLFLAHDRPIHARCDDSIQRGPTLLRRARGHAPRAFTLPQPLAVPTLAVGGMLKGAFALGVGRHAWLSHHLGDLQHPDAFEAFTAAVAHYQHLLGVRPEALVADLHPDYPTTQWARAQGLPLLQVQHHQAHVASCLAEHGAQGRVAAAAFDGSGLGPDGTLWGGELFVGTAGALERVGHLNPVPLAGGDQAARECWRMAAAWLRAAGLPTDAVAARAGEARVHAAKKLMDQGVNAPLTTSVGRLFDAAAFLLGVGDAQSFEGQAAMRLEALAWRAPPSGHVELPGDDACPLIHDLVDASRSPEVRARRFHSSLARWVARRCAGLGCERVVLTGGVFQNALLLQELDALLRAQGLKPLTHRAVPPNDGGLALGQLAVAAAAQWETGTLGAELLKGGVA